MLDRTRQLSGGNPTVGIARALAATGYPVGRTVGAVDEITRKMLQSEIIRIHEQLGVTIVFITHDIKEALKLGTRVMVMNKGLVEQLDTPDHIRNTPATPFVKELIEG
ncbi:MAG: hypothetical protein ACLU4J_14385 [Butyricimonas paravirosa]